ncbi:hypothetical protein [Nonomuraea sp. NPDC049758]
MDVNLTEITLLPTTQAVRRDLLPGLGRRDRVDAEGRRRSSSANQRSTW